MELKAIVVVDENWGIAKEGKLLTYLPEDLKYFKEKTEHNIVVMGRKTLESLPEGKPLPNRINVVLTTSNLESKDFFVCHSQEELMVLLENIKNQSKEDLEIFVAGGEKVYRNFIEKCSTVYVTKIFNDYNPDQYFPNLANRKDFQCVWESQEKEYKGQKFVFTKYENLKLKK